MIKLLINTIILIFLVIYFKTFFEKILIIKAQQMQLQSKYGRKILAESEIVVNTRIRSIKFSNLSEPGREFRMVSLRNRGFSLFVIRLVERIMGSRMYKYDFGESAMAKGVIYTAIRAFPSSNRSQV